MIEKEKSNKNFRYNDAVLVHETYSPNMYDRRNTYVKNYDPNEQSPRTQNNTLCNTADYLKNNRNYVAVYSNFGGEYISSNSSYSINYSNYGYGI